MPVVAPFSFPPALKEGERGTATCSIRSGDSPLEFQWLKDGQIITESENLKIQYLMESSFLMISSVESKSSGNYTCIVKNSFGSDRFSAALVVTGESFFFFMILTHKTGNIIYWKTKLYVNQF